MINLVCKKCGASREVGRRLCVKCNSDRVRSYPRYTWTKICPACKGTFEAHRKDQSLCKICYSDSRRFKSGNTATNNYVATNKPSVHEHRKIAKELLGRPLDTNEVVHHMDENPRNNSLGNLVIMSRHVHGRLHSYLDTQRVIIEKSMNENQGNCWNNLRVPMTTAWLETTNANVIKLSEIGQSAAEPLNQK